MTLTSLNKAEYESLFSVFDDLVSDRLRHYALKGVNRVRKFYRESCLSKLNFMPLAGDEFKPAVEIDTDYLIADVSERAIPRRRCNQTQQEEYSGKKKCPHRRSEYDQKSCYHRFQRCSPIFK